MSDLIGKFGMSEMEQAATRIILMLQSGQRAFSMWDMHGSNEQVGFMHLLYGQWLVPLYPNSLWGVSKEFLERAGVSGLDDKILEPLDELGEDF